MIVLNGKINHAKVFLPKDSLDEATETQIKSFLEHPAFAGSKIRVMPDTHAGKGSCVGFTTTIMDSIIPNIVGVDIGCGIRTVKLPYQFSDGMSRDLEVFDQFIRENIPAGFSIRSIAPDVPVDWWYEIRETSMELGLDVDRVGKSIGTLGGGNHFIELGKDEEDFLWLTIHSGSRNFGLQVAKYYQNIADELCASYYQDFGDLNFIPEKSWAFNGYLDSMKVAQKYAALNREIMMNTIVQGFYGLNPLDLDVIDSVHNYIDLDQKIIRKGATDANEGVRLVIPFNMEDGLIIGTGKGNPDWNYSAPHGAGRLLSRSAAKKSLSLAKAQKGMEDAGIFTTSLSADTLDEVKDAYKSKEMIVEMIEPTVSIDTWVKPVYNFKAGKG